MSQTAEVECPRCGARFSVPLNASTVTCPYCFTIFSPREGVRAEETQFYFPLNNSLEPFEKLVLFIARQYAVPRELPKEFSVSRRELHWVPVHFFFADFKAEARGFSQVFGEATSEITETGLVSIPASGTWLDRELEHYPFPVRGKLPFNPEIKEKGIFHEPRVSREEAGKMAEAAVKAKIRLEAQESFSSLHALTVTKGEVEYRGLVYYPIWILEYTFRGERFQALVDGASGIVIKTQYPQTARGRLTLGAYSLLAILFGLAGGAAYAQSLGGGFLAIAGGLVVGVASAIAPLSRSATRVATASEYVELQ
ncbi:hypothetical protein [Infirmifilum sp. SLHALR2]|nr:MAG: hypothetical protein B7L53_03120 [Thermofilum sp. NZ13]